MRVRPSARPRGVVEGLRPSLLPHPTKALCSGRIWGPAWDPITQKVCALTLPHFLSFPECHIHSHSRSSPGTGPHCRDSDVLVGLCWSCCAPGGWCKCPLPSLAIDFQPSHLSGRLPPCSTFLFPMAPHFLLAGLGALLLGA